LGQEARFVTKKQTSLRQLHAAIEHLRHGEYECAITLAGAAEGQLAGRVEIDFWQVLKIVAREDRSDIKSVISKLNETRDWLKHPTNQLDDLRYLHVDEAWLACLRAAMQFVSVYKEQSSKMDWFLKRAEKKGFIDKGRPNFPPVQFDGPPTG
jgi:predicted DNA-binding ribbon-helix-helix protein